MKGLRDVVKEKDSDPRKDGNAKPQRKPYQAPPELQANPDCCEEADMHLSTDKYVPCNAPAEYRVQGRQGEIWRMCGMCTDHNVKNRGMKLLGPYKATGKGNGKGNGKGKAASAGKYDVFANAPNNKAMPQLMKVLADASKLQDEIEQIDELRAAKNKELQEYLTNTLPTMMAGFNLNSYSTPTHSVEIKPFISGTLPKEEVARQKAFDTLIKMGAGALIKHHVSMDFGKGEEKEATKTLKTLKQLGVQYKDKMDVPSQTLCAFARERQEQGEDIPFKTLGLFSGMTAKIKRKE